VYYDDDFPRIHQMYFADHGEFLVGEIDGSRLIAMGGLRRVDDETAELCRLRVHPEFQRRGYGNQIMCELEARAVELGYVRARGDTTLNQPAAMALYQRRGWCEVAREVVGGLTVVYGEKELLTRYDDHDHDVVEADA
jgi:ribosomal protein S18 acetylase RimI-like enzyme